MASMPHDIIGMKEVILAMEMFEIANISISISIAECHMNLADRTITHTYRSLDIHTCLKINDTHLAICKNGKTAAST
jgi:excinuclease UvrABC nuclease subunit